MPRLASGHLTDEEVEATSAATLHAQVRELAQAHTEAAIATLASIMKNKKNAPNVRRQCAVDILNQGWGRPDSRTGEGGDKGTQRGLTINILKMRTGKTVKALDTGAELDLEAVAGEARAAIHEADEILGRETPE